MTASETYTEPTTGYWQDLTPEIPARFSATPPYRFGYPVNLPCGRILVLPLRQLPDGDRAVASLIANQASNIVVAALADHMAAQARALDADLLQQTKRGGRGRAARDRIVNQRHPSGFHQRKQVRVQP